MPRIHAGVAKANITPYVGARLAGFAARDHGCEGVHDDLFARALVLRAAQTTVALVGCDLVGLSVESVARIRGRVEAEEGIPAGHVMVACTHTHSGPNISRPGRPNVDPELVHVTERTIAGAVMQASRATAEASLGAGKGRVRIGINRRERQADGSFRIGRNPNGPLDEEVGVVRVDVGGRPIAVAFTHSCHAVVLGSRNYLVSADYPGVAAALLERVYPGAVCPFFNGTCGNVNSEPVGGTFDDARRLGTMLGAEAVRVAETVAPRDDVALAVERRTAEAPLADLPPADAMRRLVAERSAELDEAARASDFRIRWARAVLAEHEEPEPRRTRPLEMQGIRLGDALLITTPGETFVEIGLAIKARAPLAQTFVLGYANGYQSYLPTDAAFAEGGYEVDTAQKYAGPYAYAPGTEAALVETGAALANALAGA